jgi:hypothetical protein
MSSKFRARGFCSMFFFSSPCSNATRRISDCTRASSAAIWFASSFSSAAMYSLSAVSALPMSRAKRTAATDARPSPPTMPAVHKAGPPPNASLSSAAALAMFAMPTAAGPAAPATVPAATPHFNRSGFVSARPRATSASFDASAVAAGRTWSETTIARSCVAARSPRISPAKFPASRAAVPCASVVLRKMIASRASTFSCSVASCVLPRNPCRRSSCFSDASVITMPNRRTASWFPTRADVRSSTVSGSLALLKAARSSASVVSCFERSAAWLRAKPSGTKVSCRLARNDSISLCERPSDPARSPAKPRVVLARPLKTASNLARVSSASEPSFSTAAPAAAIGSVIATEARRPMRSNSLPSAWIAAVVDLKARCASLSSPRMRRTSGGSAIRLRQVW